MFLQAIDKSIDHKMKNWNNWVNTYESAVQKSAFFMGVYKTKTEDWRPKNEDLNLN